MNAFKFFGKVHTLLAHKESYEYYIISALIDAVMRGINNFAKSVARLELARLTILVLYLHLAGDHISVAGDRMSVPPSLLSGMYRDVEAGYFGGFY